MAVLIPSAFDTIQGLGSVSVSGTELFKWHDIGCEHGESDKTKDVDRNLARCGPLGNLKNVIVEKVRWFFFHGRFP